MAPATIRPRPAPVLATVLCCLTVFFPRTSGAVDPPKVRRVHQNANDVFLMRVNEDTLYGLSHGGREWSLTRRVLEEAVEARAPEITPGGIGPLMHAWLGRREPEGGPPEGSLPAARLGYPVTSGRLYREKLFLGTRGGGLLDEAGRRLPGSPPDIRDLEVVGGLLVAGTSDGLYLYDGEEGHRLRLGGLPHNNVSSLAWDGSSLWVGFFEEGLARRRDGAWTHRAMEDARAAGGPKASWVNSLAWHRGTLLVGTEAGLFAAGPEEGAREPIQPVTGPAPGPVRSLWIGPDSVVVASGHALSWTDPQASQGPQDPQDLQDLQAWRTVELPWDSLHAALRWRGALHAAGMGGVLRRQGGKWRRWSQLEGSLPDSWVTALLPVDGSLWIGTYDSGILAREPEGRTRVVHESAWVNPNAMAEAGAWIAVGTLENGLLLFHRPTKSWTRLGRRHGLPSEDVTAVLAVGDTLWVGTRAGLAELDLAAPAGSEAQGAGRSQR